MASSTESKLKSKYQTSSRKIQELYEQFASMRKNIFTPSKKNKNDDSFVGSVDRADREEIKNLNQVIVPRGARSNTYSKSEIYSPLNFQTQTFLRNAIMKNVTTSFIHMDKRMDQKICFMESRLIHLNQLFRQLCKLYKLKKQNSSVKSNKSMCKCSEFQKLLGEVEGKYNTKIAQLVSTYENKISLLVKQHQDTSTSSNSKNIQKQIKDEMQKLQDKLIVKEQQITSLKIEGSRLRRTLDQHKQLISEKESLISELSSEVSDKQLKIQELEKQNIVKVQANQLKSCPECQNRKKQVIMIERLKNQNSELQKTIQSLKKQLEVRKAQSHNYIRKSLAKSDWEESEIDKQQVCVSDYEDEGQIVDKIKIDLVDDCEPLRHTQYFNSNTQKVPYRHERKIKELQAQLQLLQEQNKLLKTKKDKFEQQCKDNESDEQKFQMQCQILRDELKNLNTSLKCLDECAVLCLKQKKVPEQSVEKLSDILKFKQQFYKKYPKKKQKSIKN